MPRRMAKGRMPEWFRVISVYSRSFCCEVDICESFLEVIGEGLVSRDRVVGFLVLCCCLLFILDYIADAEADEQPEQINTG